MPEIIPDTPNNESQNPNPGELQAAPQNKQKQAPAPTMPDNAPSGDALPPPKSNKGCIITFIVFIVILLVVAVGGWFGYKKYSSKISSFFHTKIQQLNPIKDENKQIIEAMKKKAEVAQKDVRKKYSDAYLISINPLSNAEGVKGFNAKYKDINLDTKKTYYSYTFLSPKSKKAIVVALNMDPKKDNIETSVTMNSKKVTSSLNVPALPINDLQISYKRAIEILDQNGGSDFKSKYPSFSETGPVLSNSNKSGFSWTIAYYDSKSHGKKKIVVTIDPKNGSIKTEVKK